MGTLAWVLVWTLWSGSGAGSSEPITIRHTVHPGETVAELCQRYGVTTAELGRWNEGLGEVLEKGRLLIVQPRQFPAPRQARRVKTRPDDDWTTVSERYGVDVDLLKAWNPRYAERKRLPKGTTLTIWYTSSVRGRPHRTDEVEIEPIAVDTGGISIGRPQKGRLESAVQLPDSPSLYTVRFPRLAWGTSLTIENLHRGIATFRARSDYQGDLRIGAISRRTGRRLSPHRSHQSGRDVDITLPAIVPAIEDPKAVDLDIEEIDWYATWVLLESLVDTDVVGVIFLERKHYRRLRRAAMRLGASDERIASVMARLRHAEGHASHLHVRFECSDDAPQCRD